MGRKLSVVVLSMALWAAAAPSAMAAAGCHTHDPTKLGQCTQNIIQPNAKAFWFVALLVGMIVIGFSRKRGMAVGLGLGLLFSGMVIYNPAGVGTMVHNVANQIF